MSKKRRWRPVSGSMSKKRARRVSSAQYGLASSAAMWFGTMSSTIPMPASRTAAASARNPCSPPSASESRVGSTTS
jgi:hypothetical protein